MTDPVHHYYRPGPWRIWGYLASPGRAALLGGHLFCQLSYYKIIHFIETRLQTTIGTIIKIQIAWLTGWQVIW